MHTPTELQLDALREVANVGGAHAASALSRLVGGTQVQIDVPIAHVADRQSLPALLDLPAEPLVVASFQVLGELWGQLLLVMTRADATRLTEVIVQHTPGGGRSRELEQSALAEAANIVASACLSAIGDLARMALLPSVPEVEERSGGAILAEALHEVETGAGLGIVLEARFSAATAAPLGGRLLMIPALSSVRRLLEKLGV